ncbi:MAG: hypothetical protein ACUVRV_06075 [Cyanobacteriota bacterium]
MENSLVGLDYSSYQVYQMARLLSEHLDLGQLLSVSAGSLAERERCGNLEEAFADRFSRNLN